jgi:hypothetical protein
VCEPFLLVSYGLVLLQPEVGNQTAKHEIFIQILYLRDCFAGSAASINASVAASESSLPCCFNRVMASLPRKVTEVAAGLVMPAAIRPPADEAGPLNKTSNRLASKKSKTSALTQRFDGNCLVMLLMVPSCLCQPLFA